jgi:hypothetical protein
MLRGVLVANVLTFLQTASAADVNMAGQYLKEGQTLKIRTVPDVKSRNGRPAVRKGGKT